jgi:cation:H+ antiporter
MIDSLFLLFQVLAVLIIMIPLNGILMNLWLRLAQTLNLSRKVIIVLTIGLLLSIPELFIALTALQLNVPELALGNALGTGIILISLVAGIIAIYNKQLKTNEIFSSDNLNLLSFTALLNVVLAFDGRLSRLDGVVLIFGYFIYLIILSSLKGNFSILKKTKLNKGKALLTFLLLIAGFAGIWGLSYLLNLRAIQIQEYTSFSLFAIGAVLVAPLGAIPELIFEMELSNKQESKLNLSELFTSLITNTTLILGIMILINPISIVAMNGATFYYYTTLVLALVLLLFNYYSRTKNNLNWKEGTILVISYIIYLVSSLILVLS